MEGKDRKGTAHTSAPQLLGKARMYKSFKAQINTWKVITCDPDVESG